MEFSPEDASRTELEFLAQVVEAAIEAGATTINIPDTVGYTVPDEFAELFRYLRQNVRGIDGVRLSVHCHDDLGMAVANSLTAVVAGARQIECTINGIGERAGNCSLEEVVMALQDARRVLQPAHQHRDHAAVPDLAGWSRASPACRSRATRPSSARTPSRTRRASTSTACSSIHSTYEIMRPEDVGLSRSHLVLGKHSGRHALRERVQQLGFELDELEFNRVFEEFKALADRKKELFDGDIEALVLRAEGCAPGPVEPARTDHGGEQHARRAKAIVRLEHADGRIDRAQRARRWPGGCRLQGDRGRHRHRRGAAQVRGARGHRRRGRAGRGHRLRRVQSAHLSRLERQHRTSSSPAAEAFLEVINRIELSQQTGARAAR